MTYTSLLFNVIVVNARSTALDQVIKQPGTPVRLSLGTTYTIASYWPWS